MKIVSLGIYPISRPLHGGQRRVAAIAKLAREAGHVFEYVPIYSRQSYPDGSPTERQTALPKDIAEALHAHKGREDLHFAAVLGADHALVRSVIDKLGALAPDIVQFEQPWLYPLFRDALRNDPRLQHARLIYSAQNVETELMALPWQRETRALEQQITRDADLVVAVSESDRETFSRWRKPDQHPVLVAPNGSWAPDLEASPAPARLFENEYAVVVGSAHPPNAEGYWQAIGQIPGFLPPGTTLVVAGGMSRLITSDPRFHRFPMLAEAFISTMPEISEETLNALLFHAKTICLPIISGGGTNLKTAEALLWLKPVVAMRPAMRGYQGAPDLSGVYVADTGGQFRGLLRDVMTGRLTSRRKPQDVERFTWAAQLAPLIDYYSI